MTIPSWPAQSEQQHFSSWSHGGESQGHPWSSGVSEISEASIRGGKEGNIIAADVKELSDLGHVTEVPGSDTVKLFSFRGDSLIL